MLGTKSDSTTTSQAEIILSFTAQTTQFNCQKNVVLQQSM